MPVVRLVAALVAVVTVAGPLPGRETGSVRGRVSFADPPAAADRRPSVGDLGSGPREPVDRRRCVLYLESAPRQAFDELRIGRVRMDQRGEQFVPRVLAITVGTTVDFPNSDTKFHNVFSFSRAMSFDLGRYPPAKSGGVRFGKPGIVQVFCDIHSHMRGYILVFSHPFFAMTDDDGRYTIGGIPPGTYMLMVWSELGHSEPRRIQVTDGGVTEASFQIGRQP